MKSTGEVLRGKASQSRPFNRSGGGGPKKGHVRKQEDFLIWHVAILVEWRLQQGDPGVQIKYCRIGNLHEQSELEARKLCCRFWFSMLPNEYRRIFVHFANINSINVIMNYNQHLWPQTVGMGTHEEPDRRPRNH